MSVQMVQASTLSARELAAMISAEHGQPIRAHCVGEWTEHRGGPACALEIDAGDGFQPAVRITGKCHTTVLIGPFSLESRPSHLTKLMVYCDNYFILREPN